LALDRAGTFAFGGGGGGSFVSTCLGPMSFFDRSGLRLAITPICLALLLLTRLLHGLLAHLAGGKRVAVPETRNYLRAAVALVFSNLSSIFQVCLFLGMYTRAGLRCVRT
jgi:hypothetical protein